jgi:cytochrome P450
MTAAGEVTDILSPEFAEDPYTGYHALRENAPLHWHKATSRYLVSRYDDVAAVFKNSAFTTDNYAWQVEPIFGGRTILQMKGHEHAVRRALVAPAFRGRELQEKFLPVIERAATELIDGFRGRGHADIVADFADHLPVIVIADMIGLDRSDRPMFQRWYRSIVDFISNIAEDPVIAEEGLRTHAEIEKYLLPLIRQRRESPGADLLSTLSQAEIEGIRMSDQDIKAFVILLLNAGGETTDKAISSTVRNLLQHPGQLRAVQADHTLITKALAETLRYSPPVHMIMREAAEDIALTSGTVPAGASVVCLLAAANRDPRRFAHADTFDIFREDLPERTAFSAAAHHVAFALGRHFCVGALLAKAEVEIGIGQLLDALPGIELVDEGALRESGMMFRGPVSLPVRFTPRGSR